MSNLFAQEILKQEESNINSQLFEGPVNEKVIKISDSKRVYILSNDNALYSPGDYITLIVNNELAARAIVAKNQNKLGGIKIIKIYSLKRWGGIGEGSIVQVVKGDDSKWLASIQKEEKKEEELDEIKNLDEDQLFDENTLLSDSAGLDENQNRHIKTDNLLGFSFGFIRSLDNNGGTETYSHYSLKYAYQMKDNLWGEFMVGQALLRSYPQVDSDPDSNGLETVLTTFTLRMKYTFSAPFDSFLQPYLGYQIRSARSDSAGGSEVSSSTASQEKQQVDNLEENDVIFGITLLKRLVPGWFFNFNLGSDIINLGLVLEF